MTLPARPAPARRAAYAPRFKSETFIVPLLKKAIEQAIEKYALAGARALDAGCGAQPFRADLEAKGCTYFGLDPNPANRENVAFSCPIDLPLPPAVGAAGPYDFILCTEVLEHVADWPAAFTNFAALLAPGGRLLLTAPHFYFLHEEPYDFFRPTTHAISYFAGRHHLQIVEVTRLGDAWDVLGTIASACRFEPLDRSWTSRGLAWTLWKMRDFVFRRIAAGAIRRRVRFSGPTYLSNLAILERPR